jgi:hypothetical protein
MDYSVTKRLLDRLRIFVWHPSLASENGFQSICGREHLNLLIGYWLEQANLRPLSSAEERLPAASEAGFVSDEHFVACAGAKLIGELSVYRRGSSHVWAGSRETLESILDALTPGDDEGATRPELQPRSENTHFKVFPISPKPPYQPSLYEALVDLS